MKGGGTSAGLTVIMRVHLAAADPAAVPACCDPDLRSGSVDAPGLGGAEISIGLWVGQGSTPKNLKDTRCLGVARRWRPETKESVPQPSVSWCNDPLSHKNYWVRDVPPRRLVIQCKNDGCDFGEGVPAYVVDEDIDNYRPTLLLGTVDKFASLPWQDKVSSSLASMIRKGRRS